jgi:hypothetical protein
VRGASTTTCQAPAANDNAYRPGRPVARGRPEAAYARSENVILPLRFAQRMAGWQAPARSNPKPVRDHHLGDRLYQLGQVAGDLLRR